MVIRGGGDLGSGVAFRLHQAGFPVLITELEQPLLVRRAVAFGSAAIEGAIAVEGITARRVDSIEAALAAQRAGEIAVLVDPAGSLLPAYDAVALFDARMLKRDPGPQPIQPALIVGLGPGFSAPENCHAVLETNRGHCMGRVIWEGSAEPDTHQPGRVLDRVVDRVLRAPVAGTVVGRRAIGEGIAEGEMIAEVGGQPVRAPFAGVLRGLVHDGLAVEAETKIGDLDPRARREYCFTISDKALAVGGGALEALLGHPVIRERVRSGR